jgi:hypothetical protein
MNHAVLIIKFNGMLEKTCLRNGARMMSFLPLLVMRTFTIVDKYVS